MLGMATIRPHFVVGYMSSFFRINVLIFSLFYIAVISGVTRALSQGGKLS